MPSNDTPKKIFLKGGPMGKEGLAGAAGILPGMLVERAAGGTVVVHATAGGPALPAFARPNEVIGNGIDVAYNDEDTVLYGVASSGHEVYAVVAASAPAIGDGVYLESAGDGTLAAVTTGTAVAKALEAVDNSGGAESARIKVEVL
jgi:hypothetical protein